MNCRRLRESTTQRVLRISFCSMQRWSLSIVANLDNSRPRRGDFGNDVPVNGKDLRAATGRRDRRKPAEFRTTNKPGMQYQVAGIELPRSLSGGGAKIGAFGSVLERTDYCLLIACVRAVLLHHLVIKPQNEEGCGPLTDEERHVTLLLHFKGDGYGHRRESGSEGKCSTVPVTVNFSMAAVT